MLGDTQLPYILLDIKLILGLDDFFRSVSTEFVQRENVRFANKL